MNIPIYSDLTIYGGATINGEVLINNTAKANYYQAKFDIWSKRDLTVERNTMLKAQLTVNGTATLNNTLTVNGFTDLNAGLDVSGNAHMHGTLQIDQETILSDTLHVNKDISTLGALKIWSASGLTIADAGKSSKGVIKPNADNLLIQAVNLLKLCANNDISNSWYIHKNRISFNNNKEVPVISKSLLTGVVVVPENSTKSFGDNSFMINEMRIYRMFRSETAGSMFKPVMSSAMGGTYHWCGFIISSDASNQKSFSGSGTYATFNAQNYFFDQIDDEHLDCILIVWRRE